jgi:hypothetical protein
MTVILLVAAAAGGATRLHRDRYSNARSSGTHAPASCEGDPGVAVELVVPELVTVTIGGRRR